MKSIELNAETSKMSIAHLLSEAGREGVELRDANGNLVAMFLPTGDDDALTYAEAQLDLLLHRDEVQRAMQRRGGITTAELLRRAEAAAEEADNG